MSSYIGSQISLISTSDVRYEGILHSIDPTESTIALKNVRHMGTEDRRTDNVIEASSTVYEYIIFGGENIKNLKLVDQETENEIMNDPAILEVKQHPEIMKPTPAELPAQQHWNNEGSNIGRGNWNASTGRGYYGANFFQRGYQTRGYWNDGQMARGRGRGYNLANHNNNYGYPQNNWTYRPQSGRGRNATRNIRRGGGRSQRSSRYEDKNSQKYIPGTGKFLERATNDDSELVVPDKEFDFQGNLARFDMTTLRKALTEEETQKTSENEPNEPGEPKTENNDEKIETKEEKTGQDLWDQKSKEVTQELGCAYDKDNFFDSLSTNADVYNSQTAEDMRQHNVETFGQIGATHQARTRWFRRWGGPRGRGTFGAAHSQRK